MGLMHFLDHVICLLFRHQKNVPADGWRAVFKINGDYVHRPLVAWEIVYGGWEPEEAYGIVFCDNKPPLTEIAAENPCFIGYEKKEAGMESCKQDFGGDALPPETLRPKMPNNCVSLIDYEEINEWN